MPTKNVTTKTIRWTARELRKLPSHERDRILKTAAAKAESEYLGDARLTAFEAFGKEDLHRDSSEAGFNWKRAVHPEGMAESSRGSKRSGDP